MFTAARWKIVFLRDTFDSWVSQYNEGIFPAKVTDEKKRLAFQILQALEIRKHYPKAMPEPGPALLIIWWSWQRVQPASSAPHEVQQATLIFSYLDRFLWTRNEPGSLSRAPQKPLCLSLSWVPGTLA